MAKKSETKKNTTQVLLENLPIEQISYQATNNQNFTAQPQDEIPFFGATTV